MDGIIQSLNRLKLSEAKPDQGKSRDMAHPSDALPSSAASSQRYPSRRERNHLNQKCIDALDNILASITSAKADVSSPSQTTLRNAEAAISKARKALSRLSRRTESVDKKRHFVINALQELETSVKAYRNTIPEVRDGPVEFDSSRFCSVRYALPMSNSSLQLTTTQCLLKNLLQQPRLPCFWASFVAS
jgi:ATP-dependent Clp protease ATP-binding subunit ClpA